MANKKISQLDSRASLSLSDLMAVGDPSTGYLYKTTINDLKTLTGAGVISFNGRFGAVSPAEGDYNLTQLGDVIITSASNGQVLKYNGSNWVNAAEAGETDTLDSVTGRGNTTANSITVGSVTAAGLNNILGQIRTFATTGNVSIGENPASATDYLYKLNVQGTMRIAAPNDGQILFGNQGNSYPGISLNGTLNTSDYNFTSNSVDKTLYINTPTGFGIRFLQNNESKMFLASTGNLLINTNTDAGYKLDVNGTVRFTGDLRFTNNANLVTINQFYGQATNFANSIFVGWDASAVYLGYSMGATPIHLGANGSGEIRFRTTGNFKVDSFAGSGSRILVADANGVISASTSALSGYVPYTGATGNVNLGNNSLSLGTAGTAGTSITLLGTLNDYISASTVGCQVRVTPESVKLIDNQFGGSLTLYLRPSGLTTGVNRTISFPNADGTVALTSQIPSLTNYVPYTGATGSLVLGTNDLEAKFVFIKGDGTLGGILSFKQYASSWQSTTDHTNIYATGSNKINFSFFQTGGGGKFFNFDVSSLGSTSRTYTMPDASGTLALTSDISAYLPLVGGTLTGVLNGTNANFTRSSASFASTGQNNLISSQTISVPSGSTWTNGAVFSASNNTQILSFAGSQSINNGVTVAGTVNVNRISFTAASSSITMIQSTGIRAMAGMQMLQQTGGTINGTVSHGASMMVQGVYPTNTANVTFTNYYGLLINPLDEWGGVTFGSRYGIYQAGASDQNFFAGYTTFGQGIQSMGMFTTDETKFVVPGGVSNLLTLNLAGALSGTSAAFSGRVGIGGGVSSWASGWNVAQVNTASLHNTGSFSQLANNIYFDGTNYRYINTSGATRIGMNTDGEFFIGTAASGTAGAIATMTTRLSINGSTGAATFSSSVGVGGTGAQYATFQSSSPTFGSTVGLISLAIVDGTYNPRSTISYKTQTGSAYSVVFDSAYSSGWAATNWIFASGNVGIGTNSPGNYVLALDYNIHAAAVMSIKNSSVSGYSGAHLLNNSGTLMGHFGYANASTGAPLTDAVYFGSIANKNVIFTTNDAVRMYILSSGQIALPFSTVNATANTPLYWNNSNGQIGINTSSKRYKTDIVSLTKEQAEIALKLNPVEYTRIETNQRELGFIAEEVKQAGLGLIVPEIDGEVITVDYAKISVIAIAMIKELKSELEQLKKQLN